MMAENRKSPKMCNYFVQKECLMFPHQPLKLTSPKVAAV